ncbi:hypothetical protein BHM03_00049830 [Ensete ventricosum]|nr:hypothetical protein BHM03_00049830 [Ensete ventricosum]
MPKEGASEVEIVRYRLRVSSRKRSQIGKTKKKRKANMTLKKGKGKERQGKAKVSKKDLAKDKGQCSHCDKDGYWKRNYKDYLVKKVK